MIERFKEILENAGETLEMILACWTCPQKRYHDLREIDMIPDASLVYLFYFEVHCKIVLDC